MPSDSTAQPFNPSTKRLRLFVTGSTGFIGSHLVPLLLADGHDVITSARRPLGIENPRLTVVAGDHSDWMDHVPWAEIDAVLHLAASGVKSSHRQWPDALEFNVIGTQRLLECISSRATHKPAFVMTRTFYEHLVAQSPALMENPYIATKLAAAKLVRLWSQRYDGPVSLATVFQVYGPGDDPANVLSYAARQIATSQPATFGSGKGLRDWIYIDDAASALVAALHDTLAHTPGSVLEQDIGTGELRSIREMIEALAALAPSDSQPAITFDPSRDRPDVDLVLKATNLPKAWQPRTAPSDSLSALLNTFSP